jgi:hypothetical protein
VYNSKSIMLLGLVSFFVFACQPQESLPVKKNFEAMLPSVGGTAANCPSPLTDDEANEDLFCPSFISADAFLFGRILSIDAARLPAYQATTGWPPVETCSGYLEPAIDLVMEAEHVLHGSVGTPTYKIRIPRNSMTTWVPVPVLTEENELGWHNGVHSVDQGLAIGMTIGTRLWFDPLIGHYTTLYSELFQLKDGQIERQPGAADRAKECPTAHPIHQAEAKLNAGDIATLQGHIAQCSVSPENLAGAVEYHKSLVDRRHDSHGAICWPTE